MKKRRFCIAIPVGVAILVIIAIPIFLLTRTERPPRAVWVSDCSHIVIFQHRRYSSPFDPSVRDGFRQGYKVDENGERIYFFVSFFDNTMRFYDAQTFFDRGAHYAPIMYGSWRHSRRRLTLDVDGKIITFTRTMDYEHPNVFAWNPGLENLYGIWETEDGRLRLDLEEVSLVRTENDGFISGIVSNIFTNPHFQGVYDPYGANIGLLIRGSFTPHTGQFSIVISENGNLPGHSFAPIDGGRFMRARGTLDGNTIHLQINHERFFVISGDWHFPNEFTLYRISD